MFTARITRQVGENIVKDEMVDVHLASLLTEIFMTFNDNEILEIHIVHKGVRKIYHDISCSCYDCQAGKTLKAKD